MAGRFRIRDWFSKTRSEFHYLERTKERHGNWEPVWQQLVFMGFPSEWKYHFPYLTLLPTEENAEVPDVGDDEYFHVRLSRKQTAYAVLNFGEVVDFECRIGLNKLGQRLAECLQQLIDAGFYKVNLNEPQWISHAYWHSRGI